MTKQDMLERVIDSYRHYYDINRDTPMKPFVAEAVFKSHGEEYFLIKSAKLTEMDSSEVAFFADVDRLDTAEYEELAGKVWDETLARADVKKNHRNSDGILIILANEINEDTKKVIRKTRKYKSYRFTLWGWSELRVIAYEHNSGKVVSNRQGDILKKLFTI
ncbi:MAG: hypothetical protein K6G03_11805 [Lachnospiraceae bacterium]|nr:hypothetical protein [Lachnospiraceae bacterium]